MNWTKWLACTALVGGFAAGCGGGGGDGTCPATGMTKFYVVNVVQAPGPTGDSMEILPGFNIDGRNDAVDGPTCSTMLDHTAPAYQGSIQGVDNSLGPGLQLVNTSIQEGIDNASFVILLEVGGIDSFDNDSCVTATGYIGRVPAGMMAMHVGACTTESATDTGCRLAPGQTFEIDPGSFSDAANTMPRVAFHAAKIVNGRLNAGPVDFPLAFNFMGAPLALTIHQAQLSVSISDSTLTQGVLGGKVINAEVLNTISSVPALCGQLGFAQSLFMTFSDLDETAGSGGGAPVCTASSIAVVLSGVTAVKGSVGAPLDGGTGADAGACMTDGGGPG